jgi:hypothetical protein
MVLLWLWIELRLGDGFFENFTLAIFFVMPAQAGIQKNGITPGCQPALA